LEGCNAEEASGVMETKLGRISKIRLGDGGYDDAMFGVSVTLSMDGGSTGVSDFKGAWATHPKHAKYSEEEWAAGHTEAYRWLRQLMRDAKVHDFADLQGVPVEVTIDGNTLKSWRILTEVLA
jgi:hypothetical protein